MARLIELAARLIPPEPEYVEHKRRGWWGFGEKKAYVRSYTGYAAEKAGYTFVFAMAAIAAVYSAQPRPAPIEIRLLSTETSSHQTNTRPSASSMPEPSPENYATVYKSGNAKPTIVWTSGKK